MAKLEELQTLKTSGYITVPFAIAWSQDNFLAYVTDKGTNIVELILSGASEQSNISVRHWLIKPCQSIPSHDCLINVAKLGEILHPDELMKLILDRAMSPRASLGGMSPHSLAVSWSPFCQSISDTCLLMILTDLGSLDIYSYGEENWGHLISVSDHWVSRCKTKWNNSEIGDESPEGIVRELRHRAYRVKITSFSWGSCDDEGRLSLLTGNMLGEIMMWRLERINKEIKLTCLLIHKTDLNSVGSLDCLPLDHQLVMIMMGCASGKVQCLTIQTPGSPNEATGSCIKAKSMVWSDMDQIPVPVNGSVGVVLPEGVIYIVPKLGHLLVFWLDSDVNLINFTTYSTDDIYVSGIVWLDGNEFLVSTRSGDILTLQVSAQSLTNKIDVIAVRGEPMSKNNSSSYHGISASKNRCILAIPYCICTAHDTSLIKDPTSVGLFCWKSSPSHFQQILTKDANSYHSLWDHMELIRLDYCSSKSCILPITVESDHVYDSLSIVKLKTTYWLIRLTMSPCQIYQPQLYDKLKSLCDEVKRAIICYYLFIRIGKLAKNQFSQMSSDDMKSLSLANSWLKMYCSQGRFKSYRKKAEILLTSTLKDMNLEDSDECLFCSNQCERVNVDLMMKCKLGHKLARCPRTLLPILGPPYCLCTYCGEIYIAADGVEESKVCIVCDAPLRVDNHVLRNDV